MGANGEIIMHLWLSFLLAGSAHAFDYSAFQGGCKLGVANGQKFLQSEKLVEQTKKLQTACVLTEKEQAPLKKLDKADSRRYGCGAGVALSLYEHKQMTLLKSPRVEKLINECAK